MKEIQGSDWLKQRAEISPQALALTFSDRRWRYAELNAEADRLAGRLAAAGVRAGDRAATLLPNLPETVFLIHAAARLGVELLPLNLRLTTAELRALCQQARAEWLLCSTDTASQALGLGDEELQIFTIEERGDAALEPLPQSAAFPPDPFELSKVQSVIPTSGTTGEPKMVPLRFENLLGSATASAFRLGYLPGDHWLACLPLYHVGGLSIVFRSCLYGSAVTLMTGFEPAQLIRALTASPVTIISLVPTMLVRLLDEPGGLEALRSLRVILIGGAALSPSLLQTALDHGMPIALTYGLTEASSQVSTAPPEQVREKPGTVGRPLMFSDLRILDEEGRRLEAGRVGEITVRGPGVALADRDGWLHTGDLGEIDGDGDLWLRGRIDDLILSGGEKVYPDEIEGILEEHELVVEACVVGLSDDEWGQQVAAAVVTKAGAEIDEATLLAYARSLLAGFKRPRVITIVESLPKTASGKLRRAEVRRSIEQAPRLAEAMDFDRG